ncbi:uncharacterized protein LOC133497816 isoform X2 [Syngnathoides biaculeatus]|uniref:uncharacterized protein LOC133497816 isoform X2 n=1 Tax=Syngnathoides biaculeatus TaxID=300417 RepID=UPI002ADE1787|nr:uncharacterized protein LOC133497816 isoform X2 [Syngnathoides biaculeatus]
MMSCLHGIQISLRSLKSKLKEAGFYCRKIYSSENAIIRAIRLEFRGPLRLFGYRTIWQVLRQKYNLQIKRDGVMKMLRVFNPRGCERRTPRRFIRRTHHSLEDLNECVRLWNSHRIRPSRTASCPGGIPNELHYQPHRFGSRDCGFKIKQTDLDIFPEAPHLSMTPCGDPIMQEYFDSAMVDRSQRAGSMPLNIISDSE